MQLFAKIFQDQINLSPPNVLLSETGIASATSPMTNTTDTTKVVQEMINMNSSMNGMSLDISFMKDAIKELQDELKSVHKLLVENSSEGKQLESEVSPAVSPAKKLESLLEELDNLVFVVTPDLSRNEDYVRDEDYVKFIFNQIPNQLESVNPLLSAASQMLRSCSDVFLVPCILTKHVLESTENFHSPDTVQPYKVVGFIYEDEYGSVIFGVSKHNRDDVAFHIYAFFVTKSEHDETQSTLYSLLNKHCQQLHNCSTVHSINDIEIGLKLRTLEQHTKLNQKTYMELPYVGAPKPGIKKKTTIDMFRPEFQVPPNFDLIIFVLRFVKWPHIPDMSDRLEFLLDYHQYIICSGDNTNIGAEEVDQLQKSLFLHCISYRESAFYTYEEGHPELKEHSTLLTEFQEKTQQGTCGVIDIINQVKNMMKVLVGNSKCHHIIQTNSVIMI